MQDFAFGWHGFSYQRHALNSTTYIISLRQFLCLVEPLRQLHTRWAIKVPKLTSKPLIVMSWTSFLEQYEIISLKYYTQTFDFPCLIYFWRPLCICVCMSGGYFLWNMESLHFFTQYHNIWPDIWKIIGVFTPKSDWKNQYRVHAMFESSGTEFV